MGKILFILAVICSMLSQVPSFLESGISAYLKLFWIFPIIYYFLFNIKALFSKHTKEGLVAITLLFTYCFALEAFSGKSYIGQDLINMLISVLVFSASYAFYISERNENIFNILAISLLLSALYLAYVVYTHFLAGHSIMLREYAYEEKNSIGQILFASCVIAITLLKPKTKWKKYAIYFIVVLLVVIVFMIKSRATLLGVFFVIAYYTFSYQNRKVRLLCFFAVLLATIFIFVNEQAYDTVINGIMFANRDVGSIDDLSSGRLERLDVCLSMIGDNLFFGNGGYYFDCYPINLLVQYGLVGSIIPIVFLGNIAKDVLKFDRTNKYQLSAYLLFLIFIINCLFEARPPFGPGAKCFQLWMALGFAMANFYGDKFRTI